MGDEYVVIVDGNLESCIDRIFVNNRVVSLCIAMCVTVASVVLAPNVNCSIWNGLTIVYYSAFDCLYLHPLVSVIPAGSTYRGPVVITSC